MGVDSRAAAACLGVCAPCEELLVRPGQRPGPALSRASAARARQCSLPWSRYTRTAFFWRETADCTSTGRREPQHDRACEPGSLRTVGLLQMRPLPLFLFIRSTEILTPSCCSLCASPLRAWSVRHRAVPTTVAATPSGHRRISPRGYGQVGQMGLTSFSLSQP